MPFFQQESTREPDITMNFQQESPPEPDFTMIFQ